MDESWIGRRVGPYEITGYLPSPAGGGVLQAVRSDREFKQRLALRVLAPGEEPADWLNRYVDQRQLLAGLDHPHIARLLDAGKDAESGLAFVAMETQEAQPIDAYCTARALSVNDRLKLFRAVCSAVHAAHRHLVLVRSLRPASILVAADGSVKLLEVGLAKILDAKGEGTLAAIPGLDLPAETASPEMQRGDPVTTASDVYALGAVLHRLLTGAWPVRLPGEDTVQAPSSVVRQRGASLFDAHYANGQESTAGKLAGRLRGDLDEIVQKALHQNPQRRYGSAEQLAEDVRRNLDRMPVLAHVDSRSYRRRTFMRHYQLPAAIGALVAVALVVTAVFTERGARASRAEAARLDHQFQVVRALANTMLFETHDAVAKLPGSVPARQMLVRAGLRYLDPISREAEHDPALKRELAVAYEKVGDVQGGVRRTSLGDTAGAFASYRKALTTRESLLTPVTDDRPLLRDVMRTHDKLGDLYVRIGDRQAAADHARMRLRMAERLVSGGNMDRADRRALALAHLDFGAKLAKTGPWETGVEHGTTAIGQMEQLVRESPGDAAMRRLLASTYGQVADTLLRHTDRYALAQQLHERALAEAEALLATDGRNAELISLASWARVGVGQARQLQNDPQDALTRYRQAAIDFQTLATEAPAEFGYRQSAATVLSLRGEALLQSGDVHAALGQLELAQAEFEAQPEGWLDEPQARVAYALHRVRLADAYMAVVTREKNNMRVHAAYRYPAREHYRQSLPVLQAARRQGLLRLDQQDTIDRITHILVRLEPITLPPEKEDEAAAPQT